ncbi:DUF6090 family protein [Lutimonas halocynthiae]|uniref:DUF6090 family protein n=1 Tax=Lutimonas halocynthiae TaxID=1446477 RepID=UPI0025B2D1CD|nr:DUF6090 family protein [Lutimonas halocynthiae]MDN3643238.1 DUF6090 family protein [Lutimonas halocynthiae]
MINFFRKTRKKMADDNKPLKYIRYAIGEIVLVVIGILIALSINNWTGNRKNLEKKEMQLKALRIQFASNLSQLNQVIYYDNLVLRSTKKLLELNPENSLEMASDSLRFWLQYSSYRWTFNPINGALRSAISSGEIHLVKSDSLVDLLFGWQDVVADAKEEEERCVAAVIASQPVIEKHVRKLDYKSVHVPELGKSRFPTNYQSLLQDPLFEDFLGERYISMHEALFELNNVKKNNALILKLIDTELIKKKK